MKSADVLRSLSKERLFEIAVERGFELRRANEGFDAVCTRLARSIGASRGWREALASVLERLRNDELRGFLGAHTWDVFRFEGADVHVDVHKASRLAELSGNELRRMCLDIADAADAGQIEEVLGSR